MSQIHVIKMPKWGMEMTEGTVGDWHVAIGDQVSKDDDLVDVETSKIVNTVTAHASGILRRIITKQGELLPVGAVLGVLAAADTDEAAIDEFIRALGAGAAEEPIPAKPAPAASEPPTATPDRAETAPATKQASSGSLAALGEGEDDSEVFASPVARRLAAEYGVNLHQIKATGHHGRVSKADLEQAIVAAGGTLAGPAPALARSERPSTGNDSKVRATPVARRLAAELNINLLDCRASGTRGRVSKADVEALAARRAEPATRTSPVNTVQDAVAEFEEQPLTGMRKTIATRLQQSKQTAPHFRVHIDAEVDALLALRRSINDSNTQAKVSVNDFIIKACACALLKVPAVNVQFDGETVRRFADADIAVAVALDEGLITPIVRQANRKGLTAISNEVRDLATRAKLGRLKAEEFQGGTFSVSNLGMFGIKQFDAIINPPQGAILAVGAGEARPVLRDGEWQTATVISLSLSSDHRIIDGAVAARFMAVLKGYLEQPGTMLG
jgi:pyruvate dehydrogenase E2 component (dihydrolipoamide acetyltransferase)